MVGGEDEGRDLAPVLGEEGFQGVAVVVVEVENILPLVGEDREGVRVRPVRGPVVGPFAAMTRGLPECTRATERASPVASVPFFVKTAQEEPVIKAVSLSASSTMAGVG
jgi:hypothetical protein